MKIERIERMANFLETVACDNESLFLDIIYAVDAWSGFMNDDRIEPMESLFDLFNNDVESLVFKIFYGYRYNPYDNENRESFNPNDDFFTFNGYGNLVSIHKYDLSKWFLSHIDFMELGETILNEYDSENKEFNNLYFSDDNMIIEFIESL